MAQWRNALSPYYWLWWTAAGHGVRHAARGYPGATDTQKIATTGGSATLTHFEKETLEIAESDVDRICERWQKEKNMLETRAHSIRHAFMSTLVEYGATDKQHASKQYRQPYASLPFWLYVPAMLILGALEYPLNRMAFRILRENDNMVAAFAALPAFSIPLLAHFLGTKIRQWPDRPKRREVVMVTMLVLGLLALLLALATLRAEFVSRARTVDVGQTLALMGINLAGLVLGTALSYFAHDGDRDLEQICHGKKRLYKKLDRLWKQWQETAGEHDTVRGVYIEQINRIHHDTLAKLSEYRLYNTLYRGEAPPPPNSFKDAINTSLFKTLETRSLGVELDLAPKPLAELLKETIGDVPFPGAVTADNSPVIAPLVAAQPLSSPLSGAANVSDDL